MNLSLPSNFSLNVSSLNPTRFETQLVTAQACAYYPRSALGLAIAILCLAVLAIFYYGPRARLSRFVPEAWRAPVGFGLLVALGALSGVLVENLARWLHG